MKITHALSMAALMATMGTVPAMAQGLTPLTPDTAVVVGRLENGLTYMIRHNELPKGSAEFYIAQKVGAILEEDDQDGLAHFLEHMAFNGTKNFPGKGIINYFETKGVRFGANINAFTGLDQTVYYLSSVPTENQNVVDSALLVLHDWSGFITLAGDEIDNERGVIREEWRTRNSAQRRQFFQHYVNTAPGTRYAVRDVIGDTAVINNFAYESIRNYYHKWYRPDLQGVIVVGDVDVRYVEQKIKEMWADIPAAVNPAERTYFKIPISSEPVISLAPDAEATSTIVQFQFRHDTQPAEVRNSVQYMSHVVLAELCAIVFDNRMNDLILQGAPFAFAGMEESDVTPTLNAVNFYARINSGQTATGIETLLDEVEKLRRWGVTSSELKRAVDDLGKRYDDMYENRMKVQSDKYVTEYYNNFLDNDVTTSVEYDRQIVKMFLPMMQPELVKAYIDQMLAVAPVMMLSTTADDKGMLTVGGYKDLIAKMPTKDLTPYKEEVIDTRLVEKDPKPAKVKKWEDDAIFGGRIATLSNGIRVYLKPTTYADNQILLGATSLGGFSTLPADLAMSAIISDETCDQMGLGRFSNSDLRKALSGRTASASTSISLYTDAVSGSSSKADFETMLQLVYLNFGKTRVDSTAFASYCSTIESYLANLDKNPDAIFKVHAVNARKNGNPYNIVSLVSADDVKRVSIDATVKAHEARFSSAKGFDFVIVGSFDIDSVMPAVCKWIGNLPTGKRASEWVQRYAFMPQYDTTDDFKVKMSTNKVTSQTIFSHKHPYSLHNALGINILSKILSTRYVESVREEKGGTYGVGVYGALSKAPTEEYMLAIQFDTNPEMYDELMEIVMAEIDKIAKDGPTAEDLDKVKSYMIKENAEALQTNSRWLTLIRLYLSRGIDESNYEAEVNSITSDDIKAWAKRIMTEANKTKVIMRPEL